MLLSKKKQIMWAVKQGENSPKVISFHTGVKSWLLIASSDINDKWESELYLQAESEKDQPQVYQHCTVKRLKWPTWL